jgi:hypothetical protein
VVDATLENTTSVAMRGHLNAVSSNCVIDKLVVLWHKPIETLLDHMVPVKIFDEGHHMKRQSSDYRDDLIVVPGIGLTLGGKKIDHFLNSSGSVHVQGNGNKVPSDGFTNEIPLLIRRIFEQFLAQIVAKGIFKEVSKGRRSKHKTAPVIRSAKWLNVSLKIMSRCSWMPSSSFFCKKRQPC